MGLHLVIWLDVIDCSSLVYQIISDVFFPVVEMY